MEARLENTDEALAGRWPSHGVPVQERMADTLQEIFKEADQFPIEDFLFPEYPTLYQDWYKAKGRPA
eukprot:7739682-Heterocapsa_arctica.AAC.1